MKTVKSPKLLLLAGLLSLALTGCGNSSKSSTNAPATEQLFYAHTVIFGNQSSLWGAGYNGYGQLGNGSLATSSIFLPVLQTTGMGPVLGYASGANHVVAFTNNSTVWTWGSNFRGRLGVGKAITTSGSRAYSAYPIRLQMLNKVVSVAAGWLHSVAVAGPNRSVLAWGANNFGQLGNNGWGLGNFSQDSTVPTTVLGPNATGTLDNVEQVAAGGSHTLALRSNGTIWSWGDNAWGQCGHAPITALAFFPSPVQVIFPPEVPAGTGVLKIAAAGSYSLALLEDFTVWGWGYNAYGQLGNNKTDLVPNYVPVQVVDADNQPIKATDISAGLMHVLALRTNTDGKNEVWSWGFNEKGQLGIGEKGLPTSHAVRAKVLDDLIAQSSTGVSRIYAFGNQSFAKIDGQWYAWGDNGSGEIGQPVDTKTLGYKVLPVQPLGLPHS